MAGVDKPDDSIMPEDNATLIFTSGKSFSFSLCSQSSRPHQLDIITRYHWIAERSPEHSTPISDKRPKCM